MAVVVLSLPIRILNLMLDRSWKSSDWTCSDDRVRGGSSQSYLNIDQKNSTATFTGTLDTKTLGGAGFASQRTTTDRPFDLSSYSGLLLTILKSDGKKYTLTVKDELLPLRSDGREQSTISWEHDFIIPSIPAGEKKEVYVAWEDLRATYRGRDVEDPTPLKRSDIRRLSLMMRSFFAKQEGDFELVVEEIAAVNKTAHVSSARSSYDSSFNDEKTYQRHGTRKQGWLGWALGGCGML